MFHQKFTPNVLLQHHAFLHRDLTCERLVTFPHFTHSHKTLFFCNADDLVKACHIAVVGVGKDWTNLYNTLPFNPPRQIKQRNNDVKGNNFI